MNKAIVSAVILVCILGNLQATPWTQPKGVDPLVEWTNEPIEALTWAKEWTIVSVISTALSMLISKWAPLKHCKEHCGARGPSSLFNPINAILGTSLLGSVLTWIGLASKDLSTMVGSPFSGANLYYYWPQSCLDMHDENAALEAGCPEISTRVNSSGLHRINGEGKNLYRDFDEVDVVLLDGRAHVDFSTSAAEPHRAPSMPMRLSVTKDIRLFRPSGVIESCNWVVDDESQPCDVNSYNDDLVFSEYGMHKVRLDVVDVHNLHSSSAEKEIYVEYFPEPIGGSNIYAKCVLSNDHAVPVTLACFAKMASTDPISEDAEFEWQHHGNVTTGNKFHFEYKSAKSSDDLLFRGTDPWGREFEKEYHLHVNPPNDVRIVGSFDE